MDWSSDCDAKHLPISVLHFLLFTTLVSACQARLVHLAIVQAKVDVFIIQNDMHLYCQLGVIRIAVPYVACSHPEP